jgi:hypothetical protein
MTVRLLSILFVAVASSAAESDASMSTLVGVLMDAGCPAIRVESAPQQMTLAKNKAVKGTSTRNRAADSGDKYEKCKATPDTTDFAIHTDGKLYLLDEAGNDVVRQQVRNESFRANMLDGSGKPRWLTVTVEGQPTGNRLTIVSLRR